MARFSFPFFLPTGASPTSSLFWELRSNTRRRALARWRLTYGPNRCEQCVHRAIIAAPYGTKRTTPRKTKRNTPRSLELPRFPKYRSEPAKSKVWGCPRMEPVRIRVGGRPGPARARSGVNGALTGPSELPRLGVLAPNIDMNRPKARSGGALEWSL